MSQIMSEEPPKSIVVENNNGDQLLVLQVYKHEYVQDIVQKIRELTRAESIGFSKEEFKVYFVGHDMVLLFCRKPIE